MYRHRELTIEVARRDLLDRYAFQAFGLVWAMGNPAFLLGMLVFILAVSLIDHFDFLCADLEHLNTLC